MCFFSANSLLHKFFLPISVLSYLFPYFFLLPCQQFGEVFFPRLTPPLHSQSLAYSPENYYPATSLNVGTILSKLPCALQLTWVHLYLIAFCTHLYFLLYFNHLHESEDRTETGSYLNISIIQDSVKHFIFN